MKVYKLVRYNPLTGVCSPLFIGKGTHFIFGKKMKCEYLPTKGFAPRSIDDGQTGGWHCCFTTYAAHLSERLASGEQRIWIECEAEGKTKVYKRCLKQGGDWILVEYITPLRIVPWAEVRERQARFEAEHSMA